MTPFSVPAILILSSPAGVCTRWPLMLPYARSFAVVALSTIPSIATFLGMSHTSLKSSNSKLSLCVGPQCRKVTNPSLHAQRKAAESNGESFRLLSSNACGRYWLWQHLALQNLVRQPVRDPPQETLVKTFKRSRAKFPRKLLQTLGAGQVQDESCHAVPRVFLLTRRPG